MKFSSLYRMGTSSALLFLADPAISQDQLMDDQYAQEQPSPRTLQQEQKQAGQVADSTVGKVGQRQTREELEAVTGPMDRIENRIANRVQNRIRNRIDRYYDPLANAISPFVVAAERAHGSHPESRR